MAKADGFQTMDVATDLLNDPKFRRLYRLHPDLWMPSVIAYWSLLSDSWREGQRLTIGETWRGELQPNDAIAAAMREVGLIDREERIPTAPWDDWYGKVQKRRTNNRAKWNRANDRRRSTASTSRSPRGDNGGTAGGTAAIRSVPYVPPNTGGTERGRAGAREADAPRDPETVGDILPRLRQ
jgi:hypothetical protein